jgi:hypothetical protein
VRHKATPCGAANPTECLQWGLNPQRDALVQLLCLDDDEPLFRLDRVGKQGGAVWAEVPVELGRPVPTTACVCGWGHGGRMGG